MLSSWKGKIAIMKATTDLLTKLAIAFIALPLLGVILLNSAPVRTQAAGDAPQDVTAIYTAKCTICHGAKADKRFDAAKPETELVDAVMQGRKGEKPPFMPAYGTKGMTEDQAKALVTHMKSLKP